MVKKPPRKGQLAVENERIQMEIVEKKESKQKNETTMSRPTSSCIEILSQKLKPRDQKKMEEVEAAEPKMQPEIC